MQALKDVDFEAERRSILLQAFEEYFEVIRGNSKHCYNYEVNAVVYTQENSSEDLNRDDLALLPASIGENQTPPRALNKIFDNSFILLDHINSQMTSNAVMVAVNNVREGSKLQTERPNGTTAHILDFKAIHHLQRRKTKTIPLRQ